MKKISWGLLSLILLLLGSTFTIGQFSQKYSQDLWLRINHSENIEVKTTLSEYRLFHQVIQSELSIKLDHQAPLILNITQSFRYGPILWGQNRPWRWGFSDANINITLPSQLQQQIHNTLGQNILLHIVSHIAYDGSQQASLEIQPFTSNIDQQQLKFQALHLSLDCNSNWDQYHATLHWQGLQLDTPTSHILMGDNLSNFIIQKQAQGWLATFKHFNESIDIKQQEQALALQKIAINSSLTYDKQQRISIQQQIQFDGLQYNHEKFAAGQYQIKLENIPQNLWLKLFEMQQQLSASSAVQRQQIMQSMAFSMFSLLPEILDAQPSIEINHLKLKHATGDIQADIKTSLKGLNRKDMFNFPKIKRQLFADIQITSPYTFVERHAPLALERLQKNGWLTLKDNQLSSQIHMQQGILKINGQVIALPF